MEDEVPSNTEALPVHVQTLPPSEPLHHHRVSGGKEDGDIEQPGWGQEGLPLPHNLLRHVHRRREYQARQAAEDL